MRSTKFVTLRCLVTMFVAMQMFQVHSMPMEKNMDLDIKDKHVEMYPDNHMLDNTRIIMENTQTAGSLNFFWNEIGYKNLLKKMAEEEIDLNTANENGDNLLNIAAAFPDHFHTEETIEKIEIWIKSDNSKNLINRPNNFGSTPLAKSLFFERDQFAAMLISNGAEFDGYVEFTLPGPHLVIKPKQALESSRMKSIDENVKSEEEIVESNDNESMENDQNEKALSTLIFAISIKMYETVKAMIEHKVEVFLDEIEYFKNICDEALTFQDYDLFHICRKIENGDKLLPAPIYAYQTRRFDLFIGLVHNGARITSEYVDWKYDNGPMIFDAIRFNNAALVAAVIEFGANLNLKEKYSDKEYDPLNYSIFKGFYQAANALFNMFDNSKLADIDMVTDLHLWSTRGRVEDVTSEMLENKNVPDEFGNMPLHYALIFGNEVAALYLISESVDIDAANYKGFLPIHIACMRGLDSVVDALTTNTGVSNAEARYSGKTPLHFAAENGHLSTVEFLIQKSANLDSKTYYGLQTALHFAAEKGNSDIVLKLLEAGAEIDAQTNAGETALHKAAWYGHIEVIKVLIRSPDNLEMKTKFGETALFSAVKNGRIEAVKFLAEAGANVNTADKNSSTPLHHATERDSFEMVETLIDCKANVNALTIYNQSPLMAAIKNRNVPIAMKLLNSNSNFYLQDAEDQTALHIAVKENLIGIAKEILKRAKKTDGWKEFVEMKNDQEKSALDVAIENMNAEMIALISSVLAGDASPLE